MSTVVTAMWWSLPLMVGAVWLLRSCCSVDTVDIPVTVGAAKRSARRNYFVTWMSNFNYYDFKRAITHTTASDLPHFAYTYDDGTPQTAVLNWQQYPYFVKQLHAGLVTGVQQHG